MKQGRPELRVSSFVSTIFSCVILALATRALVRAMTVSATLAGGLVTEFVAAVLLVGSGLRLCVTGSKRIAVVHAVLMSGAAVMLFREAWHSLPDRAHPRGEFYDALQLLGASVYVLLAILAAGCCLSAILLSVDEGKVTGGSRDHR